ncbi:molybdopterin oxidoreductase [Desulfarculus baarsii DSM 2075]|uniref:Molybdopterin oxidoreductase n=1 Tax=Desulfarculus baarsii (strain ATCC 33931 / DSM 2075 / LMG 7858 / VKM B-1802 / 2st14) TaxID=644282 RepID=E1QMF2_DESB2|nr:molybdopterin-dependent oxidoreductase [Desulfarculus baarsii]ADK86195.1 molybdopterin oxidoreductase [Desulfarculus baarsii DSM 2075]
MNKTQAPNVANVADPGKRTVYSMCGMCAVRCPIQVEVEDGRVRWLQGNENDKAMGASLCAKGAAGLSLLYDDDQRPLQPLIRVGERGQGQWRQASWDEALDYVAQKLQKVIDAHGAKAIALSDRGGPFNDLTKSFLKAIGSPNYFNHDCTCGRNTHHAALSLYGLGRKGLSYDIKNTRHIVLYGRNIIESLQVKEAKDFMKAMAAGAKCTYIDPRASLTAAKATRYWQIRPNTDYALNLALIHEVIYNELYDKEFCARWVSGLDELKTFVAPYTAQWQEEHTGIPAAEVQSFIREIAADAPKVMFHAGWMTARHMQSFYSSRTASILNVLFGAIETPGGLIFAKKAADAGRKPLRSLGEPMPKPVDQRVDGCGWKYSHFDAGPGLLHLLYEAMETDQPYHVGAYICYRHDPLSALPDPEAQKKALDRLDLLVAIDVNYSETAWYADVILPEATYLERANILALKDGAKPTIQMRDQAVAPLHDTRPAWWIFGQLASRLGAGQYFNFQAIEDIWAYQLEGTGVDIAQLRQRGVLSLADQPIMFDRAEGLKFKTPSGKIELVSSRLSQAGIESFAPFQPPKALADDEFRLLFGRSSVHNHAHTANNPLLHEILHDNPIWVHPRRAEALGLADGDEAVVSAPGYSAKAKVKLTPWIHPDAVFLLHGFGRTVPLQKRAFGNGVADQRLQVGLLHVYDPAGGANALCEATVRLARAGK